MNFNELFQKMRELDQPVGEELKGGQKKLDVDKDGDIEGDDLKALRDKKVDEEIVDECGMDMSPMSSNQQQDSVSMSINMNGAGPGGIRDLLDILRDIDQGAGDSEAGELGDLIGAMDAPSDSAEPLIGMDEADGGGFDQASTTPNPQTAPLAAAFPKGNDISSHGGNERPKVNGGGNPYAMAAESLIPRLTNLYQEVKSR